MKLVMLMMLIVVGSISFAIQLKVKARKDKFGNQRIISTNFAYEEDAGKHVMLGKNDSNQIKNANFVHNVYHQMPQPRRILTVGDAPPSQTIPSGPGY